MIPSFAAFPVPDLLDPRDRRVEVRHHLRVRHLRDDRRHDLLRIGHLGDVALAGEELGRDRQVPELGEAPAHVADVLVDAEDLLDDEDDGEAASGRGHRAVAGQVGVRSGDRHLTGDEPGRVGRDERVGRDWQYRGGEADGQRRGDELAAGELHRIAEALYLTDSGASRRARPPPHSACVIATSTVMPR